MRRLTLAVAAGALLVATQANAGSFPVNKLTGAETGLVDQVAVRVYVHEGRRYCFYFDGWHGPGWYRCGFAWRRGIGWGGVYGWNSWTYGPYERRHHHGNWDGRHRGDRIGVESGSTRSRTSVESRTRTRTTTGAQTNTRIRSTTGQSNSRVRSTTGSGGADVRSKGGAQIQGGGNAKPSMGGSAGGNAGGGASVGGGGEKK
jgi:hypothetical protein